MKHIKTKELPRDSQPYEKCLSQGVQSLSERELLAVILRTGTAGKNSLVLADEILQLSSSRYPGLLGIYHLSIPDFQKIRGIGKVKAVQLKCIGELSRRIASTSAKESLSLSNPETIAAYYMEKLRHEEQEVLICMMLDTKNHFLGEKIISRGTVNRSLVSARELFLEALQFRAVYIILVHNHPSGVPIPSKDDRQITKELYQAGELLGIHLLDHIIVGDRRYVSFLKEGLLP
ncbi:MAG TPA: DNA repair protein RadC [Candidatus Blautia avistercoris]|uniref:RadC family protein n=1 Tax=Blautia sp. An249 TaxID=1965603 RepID=UPI000B3697B3|nr:DNA repair protein RadC [Blautia sp. An249]OUO80221.1 hypothetical protein B5F53_04455 [Blautia sp. An249]HIY18458.1 DNA repair protein RadC [Candidatus Blautia avistercoris]